MRAYELIGIDSRALGIISPNVDTATQLNDTRKPKLTLRHLNRLKHIRRNRQRERQEKLEFLPSMYGDEIRAEQMAQIEAERAQFKHDQETARLDLDREIMTLQQEIDKAEISQKDRDHIQRMAMNQLGRQRKN